MQRYIKFKKFLNLPNQKCYLYYGNVIDLDYIKILVSNAYPNGEVIVINNLVDLNFEYCNMCYTTDYIKPIPEVLNLSYGCAKIMTRGIVLLDYLYLINDIELEYIKKTKIYVYKYEKYQLDLDTIAKYFNLNFEYIEKKKVEDIEILNFCGSSTSLNSLMCMAIYKATSRLDIARRHFYDMTKVHTYESAHKLTHVFKCKTTSSTSSMIDRALREDVKQLMGVEECLTCNKSIYKEKSHQFCRCMCLKKY